MGYLHPDPAVPGTSLVIATGREQQFQHRVHGWTQQSLN
jgi:hypothetical protein